MIIPYMKAKKISQHTLFSPLLFLWIRLSNCFGIGHRIPRIPNFGRRPGSTAPRKGMFRSNPRDEFKNDIFLLRQIWIWNRTFSVFEWFTAIGEDFGTSQAVSDGV